MNALTSTPLKLTTLALSAALTWSLMGAVVESFNLQSPATTVVQLPTVVIIGHRDATSAPEILRASANVNANSNAKAAVKSGA